MIHRYVIFILFSCIINHTLWAQNYNWVKQISNQSQEGGERGRIISDGLYTYLIGDFSGRLYLETDTIGASGWNDMFIIKYDSSGNEIWIKKFGGDNPGSRIERLHGVYNRECNCIYLSGIFHGKCKLSDEIELLPASLDNIFIARMDLEGNFIWAYRIDSLSKSTSIITSNRHSHIFNHSDNGFYLVGYVNDTTNIINDEVYRGTFIARFDSLGTPLFIKGSFSESVDYGQTMISHEVNDNFYVYGNYDRDSFKVDDAILLRQGQGDFYIGKFNSEGYLQRIHTYGITGSNYIYSLAVDEFLNIYITGNFQDSIQLDNQTIYDSGTDIFIAKLDSSGSLIWAKKMQATGSSNNSGYVVTVAPDGDIYLGGVFSGQAWFDEYYITTEKTFDWFIAKYSPDGYCKGVVHAGSGSCLSLVFDQSGKLNFCGSFWESIYMGDTLFSSYGIVDVYIASIDSNFTYAESLRTRKNELVIIANPNKGDCMIMLPEEFRDAEELHLQIFNSQGQAILNKFYNAQRNGIRLNIESEASGVYHATLTDGEMIFHGKIMFQ